MFVASNQSQLPCVVQEGRDLSCDPTRSTSSLAGMKEQRGWGRKHERVKWFTLTCFQAGSPFSCDRMRTELQSTVAKLPKPAQVHEVRQNFSFPGFGGYELAADSHACAKKNRRARAQMAHGCFNVITSQGNSTAR